ncbi:helix-turn-helix domain-containing protein [Flavobacterium oreochromis]|uniref:helix-turn-helix domain-containing protein n=1 Tax=Flavobacterium oreochromis TaxID=2906078 RepID=UPI0038600335
MKETEQIEYLKKLGERIVLRRKELNISQEILSFDANIPRTQIGRIERGEINTTIGSLLKICHALKTDIKNILP